MENGPKANPDKQQPDKPADNSGNSAKEDAHKAHKSERKDEKAVGQGNAKQAQPEQQKEVSQLAAIALEYKDTLQRLQAEFENFKKRNERENEEFRKFVHGKILMEFLPVVDSLSEGLKQAERGGNKEMQEGFENVLRQLFGVLERSGVRQIETVGRKFDHNLHEVLITGKDESKDDQVILDEFQKGYGLNGKVLRPAKVKVNVRA